MMNTLRINSHQPDILTCIANLSSDEVFTPPKLANQILDQLPNTIWSDDKITFLDPTCKTGVFLREITKRLLNGLQDKFPDIEHRLEHILHNQVFGIGITQLTAELSRRSLYCSKIANGQYSVAMFDNEAGNIKMDDIQHTWKSSGAGREGVKCIYCGVAMQVYRRSKELESYAYPFIHTDKPEEIFNMKFDVIVGNPPYQMKDGGSGASAIPIYHKFVTAAKKLNPRYISMIIPSRWFAGGKGLDDFRAEMLADHKIKYLNDFMNAKECFPGVSIGGGVNYFLWDRDYDGECEVVNTNGSKVNSIVRPLDEFPIFVRDNIGLSIIKKIVNGSFESVEDYIQPRNVFDISSKLRGKKTKGDVSLHSSDGITYLERSEIPSKAKIMVDTHKIMMSKVTSEHAGEPDKTGMYRVLSTTESIPPGHLFTDSYLMVGPFTNENETQKFLQYMRTKFFRYLLLQATSSINLSRDKFCFIPKLPDYDISNESLYKKYMLEESEITQIENTIKDY